MALIRLSVTLIIFALLSQIAFLLLPILSIITNWILLLTISWLIAAFVTKKFILPQIPKVDPTGKAILITGCDHGFGQLAALEFALNRGFHVFAGCLNSQGAGARHLRDRINDQKLTIVQMDVTKPDEITAAERLVREKIEKGENGISELYAIINNAGIMLLSPIEMATPQDFEKQLAVNTLGPVYVTRAFLPLIRRSRGRIVTVSSIVARIALGNLIPYSMSKAATSKFVEGLQVELSRFGVKSISIEPWAVRTNLVIGKHLLQGFHNNWSATTDEIRNAYGKEFPSLTDKNSTLLQNFPLNTTEEMVIRDMVDAVMSPEPELVYRVVRPQLAWFFWLEDDYLPWHITNLIRWSSQKLLDLAPASLTHNS